MLAIAHCSVSALLMMMTRIPGINESLLNYIHNSFYSSSYKIFHETVVWCLNTILNVSMKFSNFMFKHGFTDIGSSCFIYPLKSAFNHRSDSKSI